MKKKVLVATLYGSSAVILAVTKVGPDKVVLLVNEKADDVQTKALKLIKDSLGKVLEIEVVKTKVYDIVETAKKGVSIIDGISKEDIVYVNVTSGRKTMAMGLLFAAYARADRVKKIAYNPEDENRVVYLPKLSFKLTESQKMILLELSKKEYESVKELSLRVKLSTAMVYRAIGELEDLDFVDVSEGVRLTDAGRIGGL